METSDIDCRPCEAAITGCCSWVMMCMWYYALGCPCACCSCFQDCGGSTNKDETMNTKNNN